jgi:hypothetical protein
MASTPWTHGNHLVGLDLARKRLWVCGQRVHHGMSGVLLAVTGTALMLHDWKDRPLWFQRGAGSQP